MLVGSGVDRECAARTAIAVSAEWAAEGRRVVLADLHVESPLLVPDDTAEGMTEGIVDIFLYGASLSRIARPMRDGQFYLIPAGTYAPDPAEIFRNPRWKKLVAGFRDAGATLLLFVSGDSPDLGELAAWSSEAILLGAGDAETPARLERNGIRVVAAVAAPTSAIEAAPAASFTEPVAQEAAPAPDVGQDPSGARAPSAEAELDLPPPPPRPRPNRVRQLMVGLLLLAAVVAVTILALRAIGPSLRSSQVDETEAQPAAALNASPEGELLPYSVQVKAFTSLSAAQAQLGIEQARLPGAQFFISPEEIQGVLYYRILAGQLPDTVAAAELRDRLLEVGSLNDDPMATYGQLQHTPLAYDLGEYPTEAEAAARVDSLMALDVPSYSGVIPYSDGTRRWRVYGGAYRDSAGAAAMGAILAAAGVSSQLTVRAGVRPEQVE